MLTDGKSQRDYKNFVKKLLGRSVDSPHLGFTFDTVDQTCARWAAKGTHFSDPRACVTKCRFARGVNGIEDAFCFIGVSVSITSRGLVNGDSMHAKSSLCALGGFAKECF